MPRISKKQIDAVVKEALNANIDVSRENSKPYDPDPNSFAPKHWKKKNPTFNQKVNQIKWRLRQVSYPFPNDRNSRKTLYQHLKQRGLLRLLISSPLVDEIVGIWFNQRYDDVQKEMSDNEKLNRGSRRSFHRRMLKEFCGHLIRIDELLAANNVPAGWQDDYRKQALKVVLQEWSNYARLSRDRL